MLDLSLSDAPGESRIDKMRKFLSSPLTRKKPNGTHTKTFGTPLDALIQKSSSEYPVPFVVTRICQYIEHDGLMHEGVFRISGNARLIERLKACFDQTGDAPLETEGDIPSAAALLKLFFRELPDPIIPLHMHQQFLNAVKGSNREGSVTELALLVEKLPLVNFSVLKYLSYFLTSVCELESQNRMSASSLGIVFGPNLFRVTDDFVGLKEQSLTNQIVTYFITDYYAIFNDEPKYYKKNTSADAKQNTVSMSTTDSMVASWPKLSAFPSLASTLNLRPLSVSIPTMGDSTFPLGSYAEPLDTQEHILIVDEYEQVEENSVRNEQTSDHSEKEDYRDGSSSLRRKRKERKSVEEDPSTYEGSVASESKRYWKDLYFIDDVDESANSRNVPQDEKSPEIKISPCEQIDRNNSAEAEPFYQRPFFLIPTEACKDQGLENNMPASYSLKNISDFPTPGNEMDATDTVHVSNTKTGEDNMRTSRTYEQLNSSQCYNREFKSLTDESGAISATLRDAREFPIDVQDDRPAREKRFGRSHQHYQRSGHRSYYRKKQHFDDSKRIIPSSEEFVVGLREDADDSNSLQKSVESDSTSTHPPTDLALTNNAFPENNGSSVDQRYSWPVLKSFREEEIEKLSPAHQFLRLSGNSEAPLSPSAYRSYLSHRSPHLDPNLPPSPPVEQEDLATGSMDDVTKATAKLLSKKIQSLKKKIKRFEESFEASHSYRPSQAEKSQYPEVKKMIEDLNRTRQELKQLKEEEAISEILLHQQWTPSPENAPSPTQKYDKSTNTLRTQSQSFVLKEGIGVTIEQSLREALMYLAEKRKSTQRPEALEDMSKEQLTEEKLSIQKLLLQFESIHGRPSSKVQRDTMRPLYDRYRCAKRILGRSASFGSTSKIKDATELQPILEHETMDFQSVSAKDLSSKMEEEEEVVNNGNIVEKNENEMGKEPDYDSEPPPPSPDKNIEYEKQVPVVEITQSNIHANLHELSLPELFEQQQQARAEKRKLRRVLREFELEFQKEKGRKVQRDDKVEMESVYSAYKHVRARLKLLEALAAKHGHRKK